MDTSYTSKTVGEICQPVRFLQLIFNLMPFPFKAEDLSFANAPTEELIQMEGTRMKISKKLYRHAERKKREALR